MAGESAFERLSPAVQYQIVNGLRFSELRPVQLNAIGPIVDGENCVVLAPTAGGKTEAAFFPLISQMDSLGWEPVSVIYVAPIVALLNNQEERLQRYAGLIGRRAFKWHGAVGPSARKAFIANPADILLTTPESLEVMLMSQHVPAHRLFRGLQAIVIDEIHAFVGDDRGGHLSSVLERLSRFCGRDVQRIGLSATVGNPDDILRWVRGSSQRPGRVLHPVGASKAPQLSLDYVGSLENAATVIASLHLGEKRLVFVDSRRRVEALGKELRKRGVDTHVTHSSLSREQRAMAERAFEEGQNCVIVATSALELGIDIGSLDRVIQIDAPSTVASFLQRMGRTGRREGTLPNCTFLCTKDEALIQAAALLRLHASGFVESVPLRTRAAHLLAHQIMALSQQEGGIPTSDWWAWVSSATPFSGLAEVDREALTRHMVEEGILQQEGGRFHLGERGRKLYGAKHFAELYAVFSSPHVLTAMHGPEAIGQIDAYFAQAEDLARLTFTLAARTWRVTSVDWSKALIHVEPVTDAGLPRWQGQPQLLSWELCQAIKAVLVSEDEPEAWSQRTRRKFKELRQEHAFVEEHGDTLEPSPSGFRLWTFAGGKRNNLLAKTLSGLLGDKISNNNLYISFSDQAGKSEVAIRQVLERLKMESRPNEADALRLASSCARGQLSKFEPCLPDGLLERFLAEMLTEVGGEECE
ncbi:MAG: DEAD/DEAH box helicase [Myxococcales bacterium]|nr:DEAD/DEAH box helicase [Myxococcales bacterium]